MLAGVAVSLVADFLVRVSGKVDIYDTCFKSLPMPTGVVAEEIISRIVALTFTGNSFQIEKERIFNRFENKVPFPEIITNDLKRRMALIEIDVLVAISIGITLDELIQIYSVQFPVFKSYEIVDLYDLHGNRLPNTTRKEAGAKEVRELLEKNDGVAPITVSWDIDNGIQKMTQTFYPPFQNVDRIVDYKAVYGSFEGRSDFKS